MESHRDEIPFAADPSPSRPNHTRTISMKFYSCPFLAFFIASWLSCCAFAATVPQKLPTFSWPVRSDFWPRVYVQISQLVFSFTVRPNYDRYGRWKANPSVRATVLSRSGATRPTRARAPTSSPAWTASRRTRSSTARASSIRTAAWHRSLTATTATCPSRFCRALCSD